METNLLKNLLDLNNLIENFESQVRVVNRKNFKATEFDPIFKQISDKCEEINKMFKVFPSNSLKIQKLKIDYKRLIEKYQNLEIILLKNKKESLLQQSASFLSGTNTYSKEETNKNDFNSSNQVSYTENSGSLEEENKQEIMLYEPMIKDFQNNSNLAFIETEKDVKKLEGKLAEINEILNNDILIVFEEESKESNKSTTFVIEKEKNNLTFTEKKKKVWWIRIFGRRKICIAFFVFLLIILIVFCIVLGTNL